MNYALICSLVDPASVQIKKALLELFDFVRMNEMFEDEPIYSFKNLKLYTIHDKSIHCENLDELIEADCFIFLSKHSSKSKIPSLSVHSLGNYGDAMLGGREKTLTLSYATLQKKMFQLLVKYNTLSDFDVILETTHHGPYLSRPALFIEIGSCELYWSNDAAARIIAQVVVESCTVKLDPCKTVVALGGLHHCPTFKTFLLESEYAISHVCAKYQLENFSYDLLREMISKTFEDVEFVLVDKKGLGPHKKVVLDVLEENTISYKIREKLSLNGSKCP